MSRNSFREYSCNFRSMNLELLRKNANVWRKEGENSPISSIFTRSPIDVSIASVTTPTILRENPLFRRLRRMHTAKVMRVEETRQSSPTERAKVHARVYARSSFLSCS